MSEFTISISPEIMWKTGYRLHEKLNRKSTGSETLKITEEEYAIEYGCVVGEQQFGDGVRINRRDLTFPSEADATIFLLRWS